MKIARRFIVSILILVTFHSLSWAQSPPVWRYWSTIDGFEESYGRRVKLSPNGNIIVNHADARAVSIIDGYSVNSMILPPIMNIVQQDAYGQYWAYYYESDASPKRGFMKYIPETGEWEKKPIPEMDSITFQGSYYNFAFIGRNRFVLANYEQLFEYDADTDTKTNIVSVDKTSFNMFYPNYCKSSDGGIWVTADKGLLKIKKENDQWKYQENLFPDSIKYVGFFRIFELHGNEVYGWTHSLSENRSYFISFKDNSFKVFDEPSGHEANSSIQYGFEDRRKRFWSIDRAGGISILTNNQSIKIEGNDILGARCHDIEILEDDSFFLTTTHGLAHYSPPLWDKPEFDDKIFPGTSMNVGIDSDGNLWFTDTTSEHLYCWNDNQLKSYSLPAGIAVSRDLVEIKDKRILIGSAKGKLILFNKAIEEFEEFQHPSKGLSTFWNQHPPNNIVVSRDNASGNSSFELFDGQKLIHLINQKDLPTAIGIRDAIYTKDGDLWIGDAKPTGPVLYRDGVTYTFGVKDGYEDNGVFSLLELNNGKIWAGGRKYIAEYDGEKWRIVKKLLESCPIRSMHQAEDGSVWVVGSRGVFHYKDNSWVFANYEYGLPRGNVFFNVIEDAKNNIYISTSDGLYAYNPKADQDKPKVFVSEADNIKEFAPHIDVRFIFSAIDKWKYTKQEHLQYSYRVDDEPWSVFDRKTVASFPDITHGAHIFHVRAMDLNWNISAPVSWPFNVLLPWYKEPIFILLISISTFITLCFALFAINRHFHLRHANKALNHSNVELQEANAQLIQLDHMKTQFVSQASHDLRTPLTAIKGSLDNLLMGIAGALNEKQQKVMTRATTSVDRLTNLINDVLDLNRIETGRIVLEKSDIPFKALVENIINENHPAAEQKQITLNANLGEEINLHIDGSKIERVVGELISNAIKYTPDNGTVDVCLSCEGNSVSLSVKDSGIGMTPEECTKIWERFYRTSASQKFAKGSGLGLSIAKELVELHGGALTVKSEQGRGTTFTLCLPIKEE